MVFETTNFNYSTVLSVTFMQCCGVVLMHYNVRPVSGGKTKGIKLLVLITGSFVSTFGFAANSTAVLRLFGILQGVMLCLDRRANTMVER